jgi:hypothetical protein
VSTVVVCDEPRAFGWVVGDLTNPTATWRFELERVEGGTLLRLSARIGPGESGLSPVLAALPDKEERIVARRLKELRTNMAATVRGIRALAERPPALT